MSTLDNKPDLAHRWQTEEASLADAGAWTIFVLAARRNGEEVLAWGWVPMHEPDAPTATVSFHCEAATILLRTLYSAFAALHNPDDYLMQIGLPLTAGPARPSSGIIGSARDHGSVQIYADWRGDPRYSTFMLYPPDSPRVLVTLGIESVAHLIQLMTEAFRALDWPIPP